jgi:exodeoxyribonuclease V alpha subunit
MRSWRFRFLGNKLLHRWYAACGEQSLAALSQDPARIKDLLQIDNRQLNRMIVENNFLRKNKYVIRHLFECGMNMAQADFVMDVLTSSRQAGEGFDPFAILRARNIDSTFKHKLFKAMDVYTSCKYDLPEMISRYVDTHLLRRGDTAIRIDEAINICHSALKVDRKRIERALGLMVAEGSAQLRTYHGELTLSMGKCLEMDMAVANAFGKRTENIHETGQCVQAFQPEVLPDGREIHLEFEQRMAIQAVFASKTTIITGGPGTGKTTTVKSLLRHLKEANPQGRIIMAAPTGKAARRMTEVTGHECTTLHRLLGLTPDPSGNLHTFGTDDVLILDECSMMDVNLLASAVNLIKDRGRIVMLGDGGQLESIDTGAVLNDMYNCGYVMVAELEQVQRTAKDSQINRAAYQIKQGLMPEFEPAGKDLHFIEADSPESVANEIKKLIEVTIPGMGYSSDQVQILSALRKGEAGVNKLNVSLKNTFNTSVLEGQAEGISLGNMMYHVGDRVMQLKNRYDLNIQNGEIGTITRFDTRKRKIHVSLDGRDIQLPFENYPYLTHAWSTTVHKSQGSEYDCVIIGMPEDHEFAFSRKLLFTALTRGKKNVFIVGSKRSLEAAVSNCRWTNGRLVPNTAHQERLTHLPFLLAETICSSSNSRVERELVASTPKEVLSVRRKQSKNGEEPLPF